MWIQIYGFVWQRECDSYSLQNIKHMNYFAFYIGDGVAMSIAAFNSVIKPTMTGPLIDVIEKHFV